MAKVTNDRYCVDVDFASKIYVISLCWILRNNAKSPFVRIDDVDKMVSCLTLVLTFTVKRMKKPEERDDEETDYYQNISIIDSPVSKINEIQTFQGVIHTLKSTNP